MHSPTSLPNDRPAAGAADDADGFVFLAGGENRSEPLTGIKALMLAVLEDGIRCYFSPNLLIRVEAEHWIESRHGRLVFSFDVICETFGIEASAARRVLRAMRDRGQRALPAVRTRPNVRHNTVSLLRKRRRRRSRAARDEG